MSKVTFIVLISHPVHEEKKVDQESYWSEFWDGTDVFYGTVQGFKGLERSVSFSLSMEFTRTRV